MIRKLSDTHLRCVIHITSDTELEWYTLRVIHIGDEWYTTVVSDTHYEWYENRVIHITSDTEFEWYKWVVCFYTFVVCATQQYGCWVIRNWTYMYLLDMLKHVKYVVNDCLKRIELCLIRHSKYVLHTHIYIYIYIYIIRYIIIHMHKRKHVNTVGRMRKHAEARKHMRAHANTCETMYI